MAMGLGLRKQTAAVLSGLGLCCVGACGGTQFDGTVYEDHEVRMAVGSPGPGWQRAGLGDDNDLAWVNRDAGAILQVNGSCDPALDIPLESLTGHLLIGFTEREVQGRSRDSLDGRESLRTVVSAKLDGVARDLTLTVLKKDGCVYDLSLITVPGRDQSQAEAAYARVLGGFRTLHQGER